MRGSFSCALVLLSGLMVSACSSDSDKADGGPSNGGGTGDGASGSGNSAAAGKQATNGGGSSDAGANGGTPSAGANGGGSSSAGAPTTPPGSTPVAMPLISANAPAFASSNSAMAGAAKDRKPDGRWTSTEIPAWLAYDLSAAPAAARNRVLVAWYAGAAVGFINNPPDASVMLPIDYTLEINDAAGGAEPPKDGWKVVATVTANDRNARQRLLDLNGANWVRINVTKSSAPDGVGIDMDVHSAPEGATDSWLLMGDSITFLSTAYLFSDLPALVNQRDPDRFPAIIPAAIGGTNTGTALAAFDETLADYPGRFVGLAYGTNGQVADFQMEDLVKKVIALGKTPVVPHMPWADDPTTQEKGPQINAKIDELYAKYPEIYRGPDLWQTFLDHPELLGPGGDVHPNNDGQEALRKAWADTMTR